MRYQPINSGLFAKNREQLEKKLKPNALAIVNSNDEMPRNGDQVFPFRQHSDMFYLTGLDQEKCILTLFPNHPVRENARNYFHGKNKRPHGHLART